MKCKRVAVIGAGPAGITAAYELTKQGLHVDVYETSNQVGGMAKSIQLWNQTVDIGPHRFFSNDTRVNKLWLEAASGEYDIVDRLTRIFYKQKFYHYPLKAFDVLCNLGFFEAALCVLSYLIVKVFPLKDESTFEGWVINRFGRRLFNIFFKTYSEKLWGISCNELDADFAAQRIKKLSLWEAIKNAIFIKSNSNQHKTLVDQFAYPFGGTGRVYEKMADKITQKGGNIFLKTEVNRVVIKNQEATAIVLDDETEIKYDHIISSMPISLLVDRMDETPELIKQSARNLRFRNTIIVYLKIKGTDLFSDQWLYIHSGDIETGRIANFRNWWPGLYGEEEYSILSLEYWCYDSDDIWKETDEELTVRAKKDIVLTGIIENSSIVDSSIYRVPKCYPVYNMGHKDNLNLVEKHLRTVENLTVIGRYGSFKYNNQDHSILMGILAAENIAYGKSHDLWKINTDYEYQESSVITKTGLLIR